MATDGDHSLRLGFGTLVSRVARHWRRAVDRQVQPFGLTQATWLPLLYLARAAAPMRQKELAAALTLDGSSVVRVLDSLQAAGLITRAEESGDRRAKAITLTAQGWAIIAQVEQASEAVRQRTLDGLSEAQLRLASAVLDRICENLEREMVA
jgi:MarR family transcriptional regulator for hemolysin